MDNNVPPPWAERAAEIFGDINCNPPPSQPVVAPSSMSLRDKSKRGTVTPKSSSAALPKAPATKKGTKPRSKGKTPAAAQKVEAKEGAESSADEQLVSDGQKKVPRVVLKLGSPPVADSSLPSEG